MKYQNKDIIEYMDNWAKKEYALSWDNCGKQVYFERENKGLLLALDVTDEVIKISEDLGYNLIISHHPLLFTGTKNIIEGTYLGDNLIKLIEEKISVYSAHTNLDIAREGVNYALADFLKLKNLKPLAIDEEKEIGLVGELESPKDIREIIKEFEEKLNIRGIRCYGRREKVKKISLCGGAGSDYFNKALENESDLFLTGDVKYHEGQRAYENKILMLDIGHFGSEKLILPRIKEKLLKEFPDLKIEIFNRSSFLLDY